MTRLHYISPSILPSRSANSVHVIHQCEGFVQKGINISLYAKRSVASIDELPFEIQRSYGVDVKGWDLVTFHSNYSQADTFRIASMAIGPVLRAPRNDLVLSRNLHAAWILATARRPMLFETHQLEYGIRKAMQRWIMSRPWVRTIAISDCLVACLEEHHALRLRDPLVLHDAAPVGIARLTPERRRNALAELLKIPVDDLAHWNAVCGYFGQLYAGRGIEIIEKMADARPECLFLVFGGSESDVTNRRINAPSNLRYMGHVPHPVSQCSQASVDVLLMPYQRSVSIGIEGQDTARWMSPMKMFEYLAAGVPIVSSDLPVLREVLENGKNALLVNPEDAAQWVAALDFLISNSDHANSIGELAHQQYKAKHTWLSRAGALLAAGHDL
jgi:glycosyltransferase involved in cell wall biosynthesis